MRKDDEMIPIDLHLNYFKQYLDANSRCILSAKFGNGKSYFINQFIEKYSDEYLFVPIYPVNYQVMDNKDIFELIKRDILIRLLSSGLVDIETIDFNMKNFNVEHSPLAPKLYGCIDDIILYLTKETII